MVILTVSLNLCKTLKVMMTVDVALTYFMTPKGQGDLYGRLDLVYDPKGQGILRGRLILVFKEVMLPSNIDRSLLP